MNTRRGFLRMLAAGAAALGLPAFSGTAAGSSPGEMSAPPPVRGVLGVTYFKASSGHRHCLQKTALRAYFNGRDVMNEGFECDLVGQWVGLWRVAERNPDGTAKARWKGPDGRGERYWLYGRVELRPGPAQPPRPPSPAPGGREVVIRCRITNALEYKGKDWVPAIEVVD